MGHSPVRVENRNRSSKRSRVPILSLDSLLRPRLFINLRLNAILELIVQSLQVIHVGYFSN